MKIHERHYLTLMAALNGALRDCASVIDCHTPTYDWHDSKQLKKVRKHEMEWRKKFTKMKTILFNAKNGSL